MPELGATKMRYPGNDPENGPAEPHRWTGREWVPVSADNPYRERPAFFYDSTGDAYDACQCCEELKRGDLIIVLSEKVVGIVDTWPIAVTNESGNLHKVKVWVSFLNNPVWAAAIRDAKHIAVQLGFELDPTIPV